MARPWRWQDGGPPRHAGLGLHVLLREGNAVAALCAAASFAALLLGNRDDHDRS